jgi:hypothetical protein
MIVRTSSQATLDPDHPAVHRNTVQQVLPTGAPDRRPRGTSAPPPGANRKAIPVAERPTGDQFASVNLRANSRGYVSSRRR